jgi:hypothetical protein
MNEALEVLGTPDGESTPPNANLRFKNPRLSLNLDGNGEGSAGPSRASTPNGSVEVSGGTGRASRRKGYVISCPCSCRVESLLVVGCWWHPLSHLLLCTQLELHLLTHQSVEDERYWICLTCYDEYSTFRRFVNLRSSLVVRSSRSSARRYISFKSQICCHKRQWPLERSFQWQRERKWEWYWQRKHIRWT